MVLLPLLLVRTVYFGGPLFHYPFNPSLDRPYSPALSLEPMSPAATSARKSGRVSGKEEAEERPTRQARLGGKHSNFNYSSLIREKNREQEVSIQT